jgi:hypothetical protein
MKIRHLFVVSLLLIAIGIPLYLFFIQNHLNRKIMKDWGITDEQFDKILRKDEIAINSKNFNIKNIKVYDRTNKEFLLKELLGNKPKVILKYSSLQCSYCIEHALTYLHKYEDAIGLQNIIILVEYRNERDFLISKQISDIHPGVFTVYENLTLPVDGLDLPFIIVTDSSLIPIKVFVPMKEFPERTNQYFKNELIKHFQTNTLIQNIQKSHTLLDMYKRKACS